MIVRILRKYVLHEWKLKVLSLLFACVLWFATTYLGETSIALSVPVQVNSLPKNLIVKTVDTTSVVVTLSGPLSRLKSVRPEDVRIGVDLGRATEGRQVRTVRKSEVVAPKGIKVVEIRPDYVVVELDKLMEKWLTTVVKLDEKWSQTYRVVSWYPRQVLIEGAQDSLGERQTIETVPVDGEFQQAEETVDTPLDTRHLLVKRAKPDTIRVDLRRISK